MNVYLPWPRLFKVLKDYSGDQLVKDIVAGIFTAVVVFPLAVALAIASGVGPECGIYTSVAAGILVSFLGGSSVQIAGPAAIFTTISMGILARDGVGGLVTAGVIAGVLLILMGALHLGSMIRFVPITISTGLTAGVAVTIVIGQLKNFFGLVYPEGYNPADTMGRLKAFGSFFGTGSFPAVFIGLVCLAILLIWPRYFKKIPGTLVALAVCSILVKIFRMHVMTAGDVFGVGTSVMEFHWPHLTAGLIQSQFANGITIAVLAALVSLRSCAVEDGIMNSRHDANMELIALGIGNLGAICFGGVPAATGMTGTSANIDHGGRTPVAGIVHSVILILALMVLIPAVSFIPMPAIAAVLFMIAWDTCEWRNFMLLVKGAPKSDILVLIVTFLLTIVFDLTVAIEIGMLIACVLFMKRMSDEAQVRGWEYYEEKDDPCGIERRVIPEAVRVYEITGAMFFGVADKIAEITLKEFTECLVIRMRGVPAIDATAMDALAKLQSRCEEKHVEMIFAHVNEQPYRTMKRAGFVDKIGGENICAHLEDALTRADEVLRRNQERRDAIQARADELNVLAARAAEEAALQAMAELAKQSESDQESVEAEKILWREHLK